MRLFRARLFKPRLARLRLLRGPVDTGGGVTGLGGGDVKVLRARQTFEWDRDVHAEANALRAEVARQEEEVAAVLAIVIAEGEAW